jgi:hypothetical protein
MVVLTSTKDILAGSALFLVAVTGRENLPRTLTADHVLLPWQAQGHTRTGLDKECAAHCRWTESGIPQEKVERIIGRAPGPKLEIIVARINELKNEGTE